VRHVTQALAAPITGPTHLPKIKLGIALDTDPPKIENGRATGMNRRK
jgi:hypothetical protein